MTTTHQIPNAGILHTCLHQYCKFLVMDVTSYTAVLGNYNLVFVYYTYRTPQHVTIVVFNTKYKYQSPGSAALTHVLISSPQFSPQFHTRYIYVSYEI